MTPFLLMIEAERLGLEPITTPVSSPESNGILEAFHHTMRRDYVDGGDLSSAARVLQQVPSGSPTTTSSRRVRPSAKLPTGGACGEPNSPTLGSLERFVQTP